MSTDVDPPPDQSAASLLSGILGDLQILFEQQFQLTRREVEEEFRRHTAAAAITALGVGILFLGAIVLCLAITDFLHWMTSPVGTDPAWLPLWACRVLVAAMLAVLGVVLTQAGRTRFRSIDPTMNPVTELLQERAP